MSALLSLLSYLIEQQVISPYKTKELLHVPPALTLEVPHFARRAYLCASYDSQIKQRLFAQEH
jgi:hypothetical protein